MIQSWLASQTARPSIFISTGYAVQPILADMKRCAQLYAAPFRNALRVDPDGGTKCWHNQLSYWIPQPWDNRNGTVTLVGDAAHPMTFHRGQGLNNAIHDVASLAKLLSEKGSANCGDAVTLYEREMWQCGKEAVVGSNENSLGTHDWEKLLLSPLFRVRLSRPTDGDGAGVSKGKWVVKSEELWSHGMEIF